jgi:hypothetical protein
MNASGLWRGHGRGRITQVDRLIELLRKARGEGRAVLLPEIMVLSVAHSARFNALRSRGFVIKNETTRSGDGLVLSCYGLLQGPERYPPTGAAARANLEVPGQKASQ